MLIFCILNVFAAVYIECFCSSVFKDLLTQAQKEIICRESFTIESCEVH